MEAAVAGSPGKLGKAQGAEFGSVAPLPCEPGWEVAQSSCPVTPQVSISEPCKGIGMTTEPRHPASWGQHSEMELGSHPAPATCISSPVGPGFFVSLGSSVLESGSMCGPLPVLALKLACLLSMVVGVIILLVINQDLA